MRVAGHRLAKAAEEDPAVIRALLDDKYGIREPESYPDEAEAALPPEPVEHWDGQQARQMWQQLGERTDHLQMAWEQEVAQRLSALQRQYPGELPSALLQMALETRNA